MFGGAFPQIGWIVLAVGLVFSALFVGNSEIVTFVRFQGDIVTSEGRVTGVRESSASENEAPVMEISFAFHADGKELNASSYAMNAPFDVGDAVPIEFLRRDPAQARMVGARMRPFGRTVALVLIFPLVAIFLLSRTLRKSLGTPRLLRHGTLSYARLVSKKATSGSVNEQTVYDLTFRFATSGGQEQQITCQTHEVDKLEDEANEPVLYDRNNPSRAVLVDELPGSIAPTQNGGFGASSGKALLYVIAPIASFFGGLLFLIVVLF